MKNLLLLVSLAAFGCSSTPHFRKAETGEGYSVQDSARKEQFTVKLNLSPDNNNRYVYLYALRSIGEECASRGFPYFYEFPVERFLYAGFCFPTSQRHGIGIGFQGEGKWWLVMPLRVSDVSLKPGTVLKVGDTVTKVNGKKITNFQFLLSEIFQAGRDGKKGVSLEYTHDGHSAVTQEPFVDISKVETEERTEKNYGPSDLKDLRDRIE